MLKCLRAFTALWFHCNDIWQLIINTSTTLTTSPMAFLIQDTQSRCRAMNKRPDQSANSFSFHYLWRFSCIQTYSFISMANGARAAMVAPFLL
ncbi:low affinity iron permease family protein [Pseudomonas syringae group genomosp. 3]|uniref:low affinity iron permease family protein n=1 Tax=Pseudomonas syringae group genomosp. 3 TaxID=251701 RepID=UPI000EFE4B8B|nr:low affinity iron permease family protein [Pseudomonas syringae group genomosp. 3]